MGMSLASHTLPESVERLVSEFKYVPQVVASDAERELKDEQREQKLASPKFGTVFTDHMALISWVNGKGWRDLRVVPYGPLTLDPATAVFHYAQEVFEGLKAYRFPDGSIWTFRPEMNAKRLNKSATRLALPELPVDMFAAACAALVRADKKWVPSSPDSSLYLRPFMFASEPFLGVRPANAVEFVVIASPAGSYFASGVKPVSIWVDTKYHRAAPGGTGDAKCGGNYAASLLPQQLAAAQGFDQVCYLDVGAGGRIEELGGMNLVFVRTDGTIETPALSGTILAGVTRDSLLKLAKDRGLNVVERAIHLPELLEDFAAGNIAEVFSCGTAAVVTPVGRLAGDLHGKRFDIKVGDGNPGKITMELREALTAIQYGLAPDKHGWMTRLV
ncbi:MAG: branched-chain amino acid aminotransferase [Cellulomonadaceae bacterium]|nr:branched-chain amino acid aminotransferase [Cellulomonadaceae bacterium]